MVTMWDEMAADSSKRRQDWDRRCRERDAILQDHAEQRQRLAALPQNKEKTERSRELRAQQEAAATRFQQEADADFDRLTRLLRTAAAEPPNDLSAFRRALPTEPAPTINDVVAPPRPEWSQYAPSQPGFFGRRRYERAVAAARAECDEALARHDQFLQAGLNKLSRQHEQRTHERRQAHEAYWDAATAKVLSGDADAIGELAAWSLRASATLSSLIAGGRTTYDAAARELVLEIDIPDTDIVPAYRIWKYVASKTTVAPTRTTSSELATTYAGFVAQLVLAVLDACFRSIPPEVLDVASLNGHVQTIDPATGRPDHPCLVTVTTDRETFLHLELQHPKLDAKACLRKLGAEISPHPYDLEHIEPIVKFETAKYRIAHGPEALAKLDHRMDLLEMNPYEFERLVKDLFEKMGYDTWRTQSSRDDGIDAIALKSDPHMPVECIVQAKRSRNAIPPMAVQALMGAMAEKPTATHGYLVTTSWLSPRSRQRARNQRIHTIEHNQLAAMIKKLLGIDIVISNKPPVYKEGGLRPRRRQDNAGE